MTNAPTHGQGKKKKRKTTAARKREKKIRVESSPDPNKPKPCNKDTLMVSIHPAYVHAMLHPRGGVPHHADRQRIKRKDRENKTRWPPTRGESVWSTQLIHATGARVSRKVCREIKKRSEGTINLDHKQGGLPQKAIVGMVLFRKPSGIQSKWNDTGKKGKWASAWEVRWALRFTKAIYEVDGHCGEPQKLGNVPGYQRVVEKINKRLRKENFEWVQ